MEIDPSLMSNFCFPTITNRTASPVKSISKARRELGWTYRSAEAMWFASIEGELELLSKRKGQNLVQRLNPLEIVD